MIYIDDNIYDFDLQSALQELSLQRREQALKYKHTFGQFCCLKSWLMLQNLVEIPKYRDIDFRYNEHGKPYWENGPYFSISHCKAGIAVAVDDVKGGLAKVLDEFQKANVNVEYMYSALASKATGQAYMIMRVTDTEAAEKTLSGMKVRLVTQDELSAI